jgi:hypothetical protein
MQLSKRLFEETSILTFRFRCPGRGMAYPGENERKSLPPAKPAATTHFSLDT